MKTIYIGQTDETPLGEIWVAVSENGLLAVDFPSTLETFTASLEKYHPESIVLAPEKVAEAVQQLGEYAAGKRREFALPIDWSVQGEFQRKALKLTFEIPYGEVRTYKEIAIELGNPRAARAVGRAEATNPMPIVIPCHRVVGSDQKMHGYGAGQGITTKEWLLRLEKAIIP